MGWQDREYNRGEGFRGFLSNPATIMSMAVPLGRWFGSRVTLHFWFLLTALFIIVACVRDHQPVLSGVIAIVTLFLVALGHEFGHRFFARRVGGQHEEFVIWPFGGMGSPVTPTTPSAVFIANIGGILFNVALCAVAWIAAAGFSSQGFVAGLSEPVDMLVRLIKNPIAAIFFAFGYSQTVVIVPTANLFLESLISQIFLYSLGMLVVNLLPYYWFDGGNIWQSILWPKFGIRRAVSWTCIAGMVIAVPMFAISVLFTSLMGMILWVLLFSTAYVRRKQVMAMEEYEFEQQDYSYAAAVNSTSTPKRHKRLSKGWFSSARRRAKKEQAEQAQIDAILAKVHEKGLHSLSWGEKRALKRATERQRQRDLAEERRV